MKLVYGISRWTNPSRASAGHIDDSFGKPLCGGNNRRVSSWETGEGEPTCKKCIAKYKCQFCGEPSTGFTLGACTCDRCSRQVIRGFNGD
jgi:hypothetical protein